MQSICRIFFVCISIILSVAAMAQSYILKNNIPFSKDGINYHMAQAGGLTSAQFNAFDINLDGVEDLMIFDKDGNVLIPLIYKNGNYHYAPQYRSYFPKLSKWARFRDINYDGIIDIFGFNVESPINGVEVYIGSEVDGHLSFEKVAFKEGQYEVIYYDYNGTYYNLVVLPTDIPDMVDVDGDGDIDILTFNPDSGYVLYMRNMCKEMGKPLSYPIYKLEDACWGKFYESGFNEQIFLSDTPDKCYTSLWDDGKGDTKKPVHAGSTLTVFDQNDDQLYEVLLGDLTSKHLVYLKNTGTPENAYMSSLDQNYPAYDKSVELPIFLASFIIDVDRDGHKDLLVCPNNEGGVENINNVWYYKNNGNKSNIEFEFQIENVFVKDMVDGGSYSTPVFVDYNQDGKQDILIGTFGYYNVGGYPDARLILFENTGTTDAPQYSLVDGDYLGFSQYKNDYFTYAPTFGDLDNDGDLDLVVGTNNGKLIFCENIAGAGNPFSFQSPVFEYAGIDVGDNAKPQLIDLNRDGLLDLVIGERNQNKNPNTNAIGNLNYFQNVGTPNVPKFGDDPTLAPNTNTLGNVLVKQTLDPTGGAAPFFYDTGNSFILWVGSRSGRIFQYTKIDNNLYGDFEKVSEMAGSVYEGKRSAISIADIDNDDILDMVVGNSRGGIALFQTDLKIDGTVGVKTSELKKAIDLYPNPTSGICTIETTELLSAYYVLNVMGQQVLAGAFISSDYKLDLSSCEQGVYVVVLQLKSGATTFKRIVIER